MLRTTWNPEMRFKEVAATMVVSLGKMHMLRFSISHEH